MANWQDTYEELKKRKKLLDNTSSSKTKLNNTNKNNLDLKSNSSKNTDEKKWYQKIVNLDNIKNIPYTKPFDDGYDIGDITKTILGTKANISKTVGSSALDIGVGVLKGVSDIGVSAGKLISGGVAQVADWVGKDEYADKIRNRIAGNDEETNKNLEEKTLSGLLSKANKKLDENSIFGETADEITGGVGYYAGMLAAQSVGVPWQATAGITSAGNELGNAYANGAEDCEAWFSSGISSGVEIGSEYIFGGVKLPGTGKAIEPLIGKLTDKISKNGLKYLVQSGIQIGGEGLEEVISGLGSAIGQKLTYMDDKELKELYSSEDALKDFVIGAAVSGITMAANPGTYQNIKDGRSLITGRTTEEALTIENQTKEAQANAEKQKGAPLTTKEKNDIEKVISGETQAKINDLKEKLENTKDETKKAKIQEQINELQQQVDNVYNLINTENQNQENIENSTENSTENTENAENNVVNDTTNKTLNNIVSQIQTLENQLDTSQNAVQQQEILNQINALEQKYNEILQQEQNTGLPVHDVQSKELQTDEDIGPIQDVTQKEISKPTTQETKTNSSVEDKNNTTKEVKPSSNIEIGKNNKNTVNKEINNEVNQIEERKVVNNEVAKNLQEQSTDDYKIKQLEVINKSNPADDSYHTWIRSIEDIKTFDEAFFEDGEYSGMDPDFTESMAKESKETGKITVYSSYPIENGVFVSPSQMEASQYAGGDARKLYSKEVNINDVAWIDGAEGQYAKVEDTQNGQEKQKRTKEQSVMTEEEYLSSKGYSFMGYAEPSLHNSSQHDSKTGRNQQVKMVQEKAAEYDNKRAKLRKEYQEKLKNGEIRKPTLMEKRLKTAQGLDDRADVQAARRLLNKLGIDWKTGEKINSNEKNNIPTKEELDNLEDIRLNKSGSEYASAFYNLEKKYGKENLSKSLSEYTATDKIINNKEVIKQVSRQVEDAIAPLRNSINELKKDIVEAKQIEEGKAVEDNIFAKQVDEVINGTFPKGDMLVISEKTPKILLDIGLKDLPITMTQKHLYTMMNESGKYKGVNYHNIDPETIKQIPGALERPLNILKSDTRDDSIVVVTELSDKNNDIIVASIKIDGEGRINDIKIDSNVLTSAYGKSNNYDYFMKNNIEKGNLLYDIDEGIKKRVTRDRLQLSMQDNSSNNNLTQDTKNVKSSPKYNMQQNRENNINLKPISEQDNTIAPIKQNVSEKPLKERYEAIEHYKADEKKYDDTPTIRIKPDRANFEKRVMESAKEIEKELGYSPKDPTKESSYDLTDTSENKKIADILTEEPSKVKKDQRLWAITKANLFDKGAVFEDLSIKTKNRELMGKWDYTLTSESRAQNVIGNGHKEYDASTKSMKQTSKSLNDIVAEVENTGLKKEFYDYMYHKHNIDRMNLESKAKEKIIDLTNLLETASEEETKVIEKQIDTLQKKVNKPVFGENITSEISQEIVEQYENNNPAFMDYAKDVYDYLNADRQELVKEGVISQETADLWSEMYPHYVPIRRVDSDGNSINVPLDTGRTGVNAPIKKATGGNSDILPLFDTMAIRTLQTYKAIAKNSFGIELKNTLNTITESQQTNVDEVLDSVDQQENLLQENNGKPTFTVFENGEKITYSITQDMYDALKPLGESSILSKTFKPFNIASNFHRSLLTEYNPWFMITNPIKDIQDVLINSQHTAKTYSKLPEAYAQLVKKGYWYQEYVSNGGEQNSYFDSQENTFKTENKGIKKLLDIPPLSTISKLNNFIEMAPRLAEYIASREQGRSVEVSMLDAARVTTNFKAGGNLTKWANRNGATFLNASVQGAMQQVRNIREANINGLRGWANLATKFAVAGLPALLLNGLIWDDDDDYEELSDYVKQNYYVIWKKDDGTFIRVPKGRTLAVIQDAMQQIENVATGNDEVDLKSFLDLVLTNLAPNDPLENNVLSPITQVANNKTWYGEDLVPTRLQDLPASEQYDESTDMFSRWLGDKFNISPMKINYILDQYSGGVGDAVLPMITPEATNGAETLGEQLLAPLISKFTTNATMNNKNVGNLYETSEKLTTNAKSSKATTDDILKNKFINSIKSEMNELYKQKRKIQSSSLSKGEKYEQILEIQSQINELSKYGLNNYDDVKISGNYATVGNRQYRLNSNNEWEKINDKQISKQKEVSNSLNIDSSEYWNNKEEYDYAYENPKKYVVAMAITDYKTYKTYLNDIYELKADKDEDGNSVSGSRKQKVINYVNKLDLSIPQKAMLIKQTYSSFDVYNNEIVNYVSNLDIDYDTKKAILEALDMKVYNDGSVGW